MAPIISDAAASPVYEEVRRWPRHKIDVPVRAFIRKPGRTLILDGRGMEVSEGGVCLLIDIELGLEDEIELEFAPPYSGKPIRVQSLVCNRNGYRYGVQFIPEGDKERSEVVRLRQMLNPFEDTAHGSAGVKQSSSPAAASGNWRERLLVQ
jgi:PilZ domain